jgi:hypothetical protein
VLRVGGNLEGELFGGIILIFIPKPEENTENFKTICQTPCP